LVFHDLVSFEKQAHEAGQVKVSQAVVLDESQMEAARKKREFFEAQAEK
jgi:hypothetical protein